MIVRGLLQSKIYFSINILAYLKTVLLAFLFPFFGGRENEKRPIIFVNYVKINAALYDNLMIQSIININDTFYNINFHMRDETFVVFGHTI